MISTRFAVASISVTVMATRSLRLDGGSAPMVNGPGQSQSGHAATPAASVRSCGGSTHLPVTTNPGKASKVARQPLRNVTFAPSTGSPAGSDTEAVNRWSGRWMSWARSLASASRSEPNAPALPSQKLTANS